MAGCNSMLPGKAYRVYKKLKRIHGTKRHLKRLGRIASYGGYPCGAYYDRETGRLKRCYRGRRSAYYKQVASRKARNAPDYPSRGSGYKKVYDFWWELC